MTLNPKFLRTSRLVGEEAVYSLQKQRVAVVGLGAVGSYVVEALARSGVGHFLLVDFDTIGITNFNRQLYACDSTLGRKKVEVAQERILDINSEATVEILELFVHNGSVAHIFADRVDLVIDAIDSLNPKVALLQEAYQRNIPTISSMGAALKRDAAQIQVADLMETYGCALAKQVRANLRKRGVGHGITALFSPEAVHFEYREPHLEEYADFNEQVHDQGRRRRVLGSLPTITGLFGLRIAHEALVKLLAQHPPVFS